MKSLKMTAIIILSFQLSCCGDRFASGYILELPVIPESWVSLLGEPHWRIEWLGTDGQTQKKDILPGKTTEIEIPVTWTNPVTAWPYWPGYNLIPGTFKPAGALFPFDVSGKSLNLSWKAGPDTIFYRELAFSNNQNLSKIPANFDWPRFRELFETEVLNEAVRKDPWLVDWRYVAERTINSNFDRRRLVPEVPETVNIPVSPGLWYGTSPFANPLFFKEGEPLFFPVRSGINVWISSEGILRCNGKTWVFLENVPVAHTLSIR
jgi:hypothetical protein